VLREKRVEQATETWAQEIRARAYVEYREPPQT
jgi:peptidyl-prolyl cis-trans isomerase SurA